MSEREKEIILCGQCKKWEFYLPATKRHNNEPFGVCKLFRAKNGHPEEQSLAIATSSITEGVSTWLETSEKFGCILGEDSGKKIDWSKFANFTIPTLEEIINRSQNSASE